MIALHIAEDNELIYINDQRIDLITPGDDGTEIVMQHVGVIVSESPEEVIRIINGRFN